MSDDDEMAIEASAGPSQPGQFTSQSAVSQQEWDKLSLRFSDVSHSLWGTLAIIEHHLWEIWLVARC